jgi:hypothetical protein
MATCPRCGGTRRIKKTYPAPKDIIYGFLRDWPCPECYGMGEVSCCEGAIGGHDDITNRPAIEAD